MRWVVAGPRFSLIDAFQGVQFADDAGIPLFEIDGQAYIVHQESVHTPCRMCNAEACITGALCLDSPALPPLRREERLASGVGLPYALRLQDLTPLLQTQKEALDPGMLLGARTVVQELLHTGHLDIGITRLSQYPCDTTQLLTPPRTGLVRQRGSKQGQHIVQAA